MCLAVVVELSLSVAGCTPELKAVRATQRNHGALYWGSQQVEPLLVALRAAREALSVPLLTGLVLETDAQETNSVLLLPPNKNDCKHCRYDKQVLIPFLERVPRVLADKLAGANIPRLGHLESGKANALVEILPGHFAAIAICYEALFQRQMRDPVRREAGLFINVSNDDWLEGAAAPAMHFYLAQLAAIEYRRYFIRATLGGISGVVNPYGEVVDQLGTGVAGVIRTRIRWLPGRTVYQTVGNAPWWLLIVSVTALRIWPRRDTW
ncbi:MAG: apolipoprotein N-acyltransferase [Polyangiaceae bacterium]|nr:apolipoprotein N-acyltransferase [Polyangiaceae bacterium]